MPNTEEDKNEDIILPKSEAPKDPKEEAKIQSAIEDRVSRITQEFEEGFKIIKQYPKSISIFGSARATEDMPHYIWARELARKISKEGYAVITGGGHGIMEAANRGAHEAGGHSIGLNIELPKEQSVNKYVTDHLEFHYFFSRKMMLSFSAETYVFFPGGYGTLDEFFEIVTLVQTHKIPKVPIICVGRDYWGNIEKHVVQDLFLKKYKTITPGDENLYKICDDIDEAISIILEAPIREEN